MPESVTDRPTKAHEYLFLLTKRPHYFYDAEAIREPHLSSADAYANGAAAFRDERAKHMATATGGKETHFSNPQNPAGRNRRTVWTIPTQPYRGAHFATFPEKLVEPCILAGTSPKACGVCGAPWERVVDTPKKPVGLRNADKAHGGLGNNLGGQAHQDWRAEHPPETIGWRPTCDHADDTGSCLVLDPFCGSGTVGAVARRFGRRFVGLDLSAPYLQLARQRIDSVPLGMGI
jgi:hypothetical protein